MKMSSPVDLGELATRFGFVPAATLDRSPGFRQGEALFAGVPIHIVEAVAGLANHQRTDPDVSHEPVSAMFLMPAKVFHHAIHGDVHRAFQLNVQPDSAGVWKTRRVVSPQAESRVSQPYRSEASEELAATGATLGLD